MHEQMWIPGKTAVFQIPSLSLNQDYCIDVATVKETQFSHKSVVYWNLYVNQLYKRGYCDNYL